MSCGARPPRLAPAAPSLSASWKWKTTAPLVEEIATPIGRLYLVADCLGLVHAGSENNQQQWRHAKPCVQIAEGLLGEARELANACLPPPAPAAPPPPAPAPVVQPREAAPPVLVALPPPPPVQPEELVRKIQREKLVVQSIKLGGHADRLNSTVWARQAPALHLVIAAVIRRLVC